MAETKTANSEGKPKGQLDVRTLKQADECVVVFNDGKSLRAELVGVDNYNILVKSQGQVILIPKHSIKYILL
jgi:sRNA-binding regulator protein Hfq